MTSTTLLDLVLGNLGAIVLLCVAIVAIWRGWFVPARAYEREVERVDRLDEISLTALKTTETVLEHQRRALGNHEKLLDNQQTMMQMGRDIIAGQEHAKEIFNERYKRRGRE
jgi:uncharacterized ion transporter superfamily protein YfcC